MGSHNHRSSGWTLWIFGRSGFTDPTFSRCSPYPIRYNYSLSGCYFSDPTRLKIGHEFSVVVLFHSTTRIRDSSGLFCGLMPLLLTLASVLRL